MNTIRELKKQEKYKSMLKRKNKEKKIYKDKNASLQFEKQKLYKALLNREKEIERLKQEHEAIKKYVHNHTITYIDNGIECCKPDEYFNISCVEDMLNGNFENLDVLFEDSDK